MVWPVFCAHSADTARIHTLVSVDLLHVASQPGNTDNEFVERLLRHSYGTVLYCACCVAMWTSIVQYTGADGACAAHGC